MANQSQQILTALKAAGSAGCTKDQLAELLWADGGPVNKSRQIQTLVSYLRNDGHKISSYFPRRRYVLAASYENGTLSRALRESLRLRHLITGLEKQLPSSGSIVLLLSAETRDKLRHEAKSRNMPSIEKLAAVILTMVANDSLFNAVLDP